MKGILVPCIFLLMWDLEINADTYEVLTIPYDKIFPERYGQNGHNYQRPGHQQQRPGYQQPHRPHYQTQKPGYQQPNYPNYPNYQQPGAGASAADWVCRNPSTGDMLIISSDSLPFGNTQDPRQPQVPNVQSNHPSQPGQPQYPGQNQGPQTPSQNPNPVNPFLPNSNQTPAPINCNDYNQHPMCGETIILGTTTTRAPETTPNTNGQGIIDIRMRGQYPSTKDEDPDRLVFHD